jgi:hypothetical protein
MRFKALRKKSTGEFLREEFIPDYGWEYTPPPVFFPLTAKIEDIKELNPDLDFSDIELIEYEFKEVRP